jgi:hypothetical protein
MSPNLSEPAGGFEATSEAYAAAARDIGYNNTKVKHL